MRTSKDFWISAAGTALTLGGALSEMEWNKFLNKGQPAWKNEGIYKQKTYLLSSFLQYKYHFICKCRIWRVSAGRERLHLLALHLLTYILCVSFFLLSTESSEESFPHTPTSLQLSPDSSDIASVESQQDSSYPPDYLFLSQCETGGVITSRYVQCVQHVPQAEIIAVWCV